MANLNYVKRIAPIIPILFGVFASRSLLVNSSNSDHNLPDSHIPPASSQGEYGDNAKLSQEIRQDVVYGGKQRMNYDTFMNITGMERKFGAEYNGYPVWVDVENSVYDSSSNTFALSKQRIDAGQVSISLTPEKAREVRGKLEVALHPASSDSTGFP